MMAHRGAPLRELDTHLPGEEREIDQRGERLHPRRPGIDALAVAVQRVLGDVPPPRYATARKSPLPSGDRSTCPACESLASA